jgi:hypothetical protein
MQKNWENFVFGLFFGLGFGIANLVFQLIAWVASHAHT